MSDDTARLHLPQLVSLQELNAVTWNEALEQIDALVDLCFSGMFVNDPPSSPQDGDTYLVGSAPTGAWNGYPYKIASSRDGAWRFYAPFNGQRAFVRTTGAIIVYSNGAWNAPVISGGTINNAAIGGTTPAAGRFTILGVNATADATNKFALASSAVLFDNIGNGVQLKLNKRASGDSASVLYQTNYSGRAEIGLCGDDNFHFKVSPDGSSWTDAITLDKTAGSVGIGTTPSAFRLQVAGSIGPSAANCYNLGSAALYWANGYIQNAWTVVCDETLKDEIAGLSDAEMAVAKEIAPLVSLYKMKSAIAEKGSARARKHCGWIAQRIEQVFTAHGLDPFAYGCVGCDTVSMEEPAAPKIIHNLRIAEVTAFALAGLAARVAALEAERSHA